MIAWPSKFSLLTYDQVLLKHDPLLEQQLANAKYDHYSYMSINSVIFVEYIFVSFS